MNQLIPVAASTVVPALLCLAVAYPLRGQAGRHAATQDPHRQPRPASAILARLADEVTTGEIPRDLWGGVDRPSELTAGRDTRTVIVVAA